MNLSPKLVSGLAEFGEEVAHLRDHFPEDTPDADWLEDIGKRGWVLITKDRAIGRRPIEREALKTHKVGAFFLLGKNMAAWNQIKQVIRAWERINELSASTKRPFAYKVSTAGRTLTSLALD